MHHYIHVVACGLSLPGSLDLAFSLSNSLICYPPYFRHPGSRLLKGILDPAIAHPLQNQASIYPSARWVHLGTPPRTVRPPPTSILQDTPDRRIYPIIGSTQPDLPQSETDGSSLPRGAQRPRRPPWGYTSLDGTSRHRRLSLPARSTTGQDRNRSIRSTTASRRRCG
ncbi:hypothetical protein VUR80DRAFT_1371 [Thermomyces stellatus]